MNLCFGHTRGYTGPPIISKGLGSSSKPGDSPKKVFDKNRGIKQDKLDFAHKLYSLNLHGKGFTQEEDILEQIQAMSVEEKAQVMEAYLHLDV